jgi:hypothetical protein
MPTHDQRQNSNALPAFGAAQCYAAIATECAVIARRIELLGLSLNNDNSRQGRAIYFCLYHALSEISSAELEAKRPSSSYSKI